MKSVVKTGRTKEEALVEALKELGVGAEEVEVTVLEETTKGLLGLWGSKSVKIQVKVKDNPGQVAEFFLREMLVNMGVLGQVEIFRRPDHITLNINGRDLGILIGKHGQTLDAIQSIINLVVNKDREKKERIIVDVEGYRRRREETLRRLALKVADKVKREGRKEALEPMSPHERRIIHASLQEIKGISTYSVGEDPYRHVIVSPQESLD